MATQSLLHHSMGGELAPECCLRAPTSVWGMQGTFGVSTERMERVIRAGPPSPQPGIGHTPRQNEAES